MKIEQLYTNCLSEAAYFIESDGEAAVVDPLRDYQQYIKMAEERNVKIKYVFETHFHADFVSGHIDLASHTGSEIIYGPGAETNYKVTVADNHQKFSVGKISIEVLHTPGHTPESSCYLLSDESGKKHAVFTGDTLFVGDVGRPDLFGAKITKEELAAMMYDSLNNVLKKLPDDVIVYPAHGPGSSCGKNLGPETFSTIGKQKESNYAMSNLVREDFIKSLTTGLLAPPQYFPLNAQINKSGYSSLDSVYKHSLTALSVEQVNGLRKTGSLILDVREPNDFELGFIPGSLNVGLSGRFAEWVGTLVDMKKNLVLVTPVGKEQETITRLARVGYENISGYLEGGFDSWKNSRLGVDLVISIDADELLLDYKHDKNLVVIDVRKPTEFDTSHIEKAENFSLQNLQKELTGIPRDKTLYIHCAAGYRSMIASSILKQHGIHNLKNIYGGFSSIKKTDIPIESTVAQMN